MDHHHHQIKFFELILHRDVGPCELSQSAMESINHFRRNLVPPRPLLTSRILRPTLEERADSITVMVVRRMGQEKAGGSLQIFRVPECFRDHLKIRDFEGCEWIEASAAALIVQDIQDFHSSPLSDLKSMTTDQLSDKYLQLRARILQLCLAEREIQALRL